MKVSTGKMCDGKSKEFLDACGIAADLIRKGLSPPLAIWKVANEYGYTTQEIAAELGSRKKKRRDANGGQKTQK